MDERQRRETLFEVRTCQVIRAMAYHGCRGEAVLYLTGLYVMQREFDWDAAHTYVLN
jgi:hypothetical protein